MLAVLLTQIAKGCVFEEGRPTEDMTEDARFWKVMEPFNKFTVWGLGEEPNPNNDGTLRTMEWLKVAHDVSWKFESEIAYTK
jgi:hypothetical protein